MDHPSDKQRVHQLWPVELVEAVDEECRERGWDRTQVTVHGLSEWLRTQRVTRWRRDAP